MWLELHLLMLKLVFQTRFQIHIKHYVNSVCLFKEINNIIHVHPAVFVHSTVVFWLYHMEYSWPINDKGTKWRWLTTVLSSEVSIRFWIKSDLDSGYISQSLDKDGGDLAFSCEKNPSVSLPRSWLAMYNCDKVFHLATLKSSILQILHHISFFVFDGCFNGNNSVN